MADDDRPPGEAPPPPPPGGWQQPGPDEPGWGQQAGGQQGGQPGWPPQGQEGWGQQQQQPGWGQQQQPGWGQQPPPGGGWPQQPGYYQPQQTEGTAVGALVCAIGSWMVCPVVLAVVALVLASQADRKIKASGGALGGDGLVTASKWIAWINLGLFALVAAFFVLILVFSVAVGDQDLRIEEGLGALLAR